MTTTDASATAAATAAALAEAGRAGEALAAVIEAENQALAARDWATVGRLAADKRAAADAYARAVAGLADGGPLPAAAKRQLLPIAERLGRACEDNERRLTVLMFAQRRVIEAIAEAAASLAATGYARTGARAGAGAAALSLNRAC